MKLENYIKIERAEKPLILKALQQFSNMYASSGVTNDLAIYQSKDRSDLFTIKSNDQIDLERFKYLVNYLKYPEEINYDIDVNGYWTISEADQNKNLVKGKRVMFYLSPADTEYDNVFGIFKGENETIKFGFAVRQAYKVQDKKEIDFYEPQLSMADFELIGTVNPDPSVKPTKGKGCLLSFLILTIITTGITLFVYNVL